MRMRRWLLFAGVPLFLTGSAALAQVVAGPGTNLTNKLKTQELWVRVGAQGTKIAYTCLLYTSRCV